MAGYRWLRLAVLITGLGMATGALADEALRIGTDPGYPPFEYRDSDGTLKGFDIAVGDEVCRRMQRRCEWIDRAFEDLLPGLQARRFDLIHSAITATDARARLVDFSTPIYSVPVRLLVRRGSGLQPTARSLKGRRVGVQQGTTMEAYARREWAPAGVLLKSYPDFTRALIDLATGQLDATLQEAHTATHSLLNKSEGTGFELASQPLDAPELNQPVAMAVRKGDEALLADVDRALRAMREDGTLARLASRYFPPDQIILH